MNVPQLSSFTEDDASLLSINGLPFSNEETILPIRFEIDFSGEITFTAKGLQSFNEGMSIKLEDRLINRMTDLTANNSVAIMHQSTDDPYRFRLHFSGVNAVTENADSKQSSIYLVNNELYISYKPQQDIKAKAAIYNSIGQLISMFDLSGSGEDHHDLQASCGVYIVKLWLASGSETHKVVLR